MVSVRDVHVEVISANYLFNRLQNASGCLLFDLRNLCRFIPQHIVKFTNLSPTTLCDLTSMSQLEQELAKHKSLFASLALAQLHKRRLTDIILCDQHGRLAESIGHHYPHHHHKKKNQKTRNSPDEMMVLKLIDLLKKEAKVVSIKYLDHGVAFFAKSYPFLMESSNISSICRKLTIIQQPTEHSNRTLSGLHAVAYPNEILENFLYLGNMWQGKQRNILDDIGITHIVRVHTARDGKLTRVGNITYYNIEVKDKFSTPLIDHFQKVVQFIDSAKKQKHGKVLIHCVQGVSRSATFAIWYIMCTHKKYRTLVDAYNFVYERRNIIYPNSGFMKQLMDAEVMKYGCSSLNNQDEIDILQSGNLPNRPLNTVSSFLKRIFVRPFGEKTVLPNCIR